MAETKPKTGTKPSKRVLDPKRKKRQVDTTGEPSKEEYAVAKFVRFKCPTKKGNFGHGMGGEEVVYFVGSKAVDCLLESKWSSTKGSKKKDQALFTDRQSAVDYMQQLLMRGLFFRAKKLIPKIKEKTAETGEKKKGDQGKKGAETKEELPKSPKAAKESEVKRRKKDKSDKEDEEKVGKDKKDKDKEKEKEKDDGDNEKEKSTEKSSKARKVKLDWHQEQLFIDGPSIFIWKYDPTPLKTWLLGLAIVLGAAACCLFPLWPMQLRLGVYYVSSTALIFIISFFCFVVLRTVLFGLIWAVTLGRHHFWLFPNLTEDCGVMESFKPVYSHKYCPSGSKSSDDEKKKKKDKKSDSEDEGEGGDDEAGESKHDQAEDRGSESESNDDEQAKDGDTTHDDIDDDGEKSDGNSTEQSARTSTDDEPQASKGRKSPKKRRGIRRDDGQESSVNGDYEIVDPPKKID